MFRKGGTCDRDIKLKKKRNSIRVNLKCEIMNEQLCYYFATKIHDDEVKPVLWF